MSKINVLDSFVFNRIAAGEVVEKPCSAVKELVENSIDAGANNISISIIGGGLKKIEVSDDGSGIEYEELPKAFLPHATSKISTLDDLEKIATLGFRGEALASIASVSEIELTSKTNLSEFGGKVMCEAGKIGQCEQIGCANGTRIVVKNLFYNVPARLKFVRKEKTEENDITNYIARLILSHPNISFSYFANDKLIYKHLASDLKTAILDIYGYENDEQLIFVSKNRGDMKVSGYIGRPEIAKSNKTYQTLIINGRYVVNYMIASAISNVYEDYLMKGKYPFYVLNLDIPFDKIDVNVHPSKLEVKFEDNNAIFSLFNSACFGALNQTNFTTEAKLVDQNKQQTYIEPIGDKIHLDIDEGQSFSKTTTDITQSVSFENKTSLMSEIMLTKMAASREQVSLIKNDNLFEVKEPINHLCTLFDTYFVLEKGKNVYFVDQHAAHERLNYDKFKQQIDNNSIQSQRLLFPYVFKVNNQEENFIVENIESLKAIGFKVEEFGKSCFRVEEVPVILSGINLKDYFDDLFKNLSTFINKPLSFIKDSLCQKACKSSVKGGDKLSEFEISSLIDELEQKNATLLCPHGRPIVVKISQTDIEKWFKRIV